MITAVRNDRSELQAEICVRANLAECVQLNGLVDKRRTQGGVIGLTLSAARHQRVSNPTEISSSARILWRKLTS